MNMRERFQAINGVYKFTDKHFIFKNKLERDLFIRCFLQEHNMRFFTETENCAAYGFTQRNALQVAKVFPKYRKWVYKQLNK